MNIDLLIATRRKELNLTLEDIARHVGVSKSTVKKWESGYIKNMKRDKMSLLAEILKISPIALLDNSNAAPPESNNYSVHEIELITKYRTLDENGRALVDRVVDTVYEQRRNGLEDSSDETTAS